MPTVKLTDAAVQRLKAPLAVAWTISMLPIRGLRCG
jgi:hypothetical protein